MRHYMRVNQNWHLYIEKDTYTYLYSPKKEVNVATVVFMEHHTCSRFTRAAVVERRTGEVFFNKKSQWKCQWCKCEFPGPPEDLKEQIKRYVILFDISELNI